MDWQEKTADFIARHQSLILPTTIHKREDEVIVRGDGAWVETMGGKKYFDATAQVSCANIGHNNSLFLSLFQRFVDSMHRKKAISTVMGTDFYYQNAVRLPDGTEQELSPPALASLLAPHIFGAENTQFLFMDDGTDAASAAIRVCRTATKKQFFLSFEDGFHGRMGEARDASFSNPIHWDESSRGGLTCFLPYPETENDFTLAKKALSRLPLAHCAGAIYEPAQGEGGGMRIGRFLKPMEELLHKKNIITVADEIQTGLGRYGTWFAYQTLDLNPDIVLVGKSLSGGLMPVSAAAFRTDRTDRLPLDRFPEGKVSGTFPMYALGMAAAIAAMITYEKQGIVANAKHAGELLGVKLKEAIAPYDESDGFTGYYKLDGAGLFRSVKPMTWQHQPNPELTETIIRRLRELGVWTIAAARGTAFRLTPPLTSSDDEITFLCNAVHKAIHSL